MESLTKEAGCYSTEGSMRYHYNTQTQGTTGNSEEKDEGVEVDHMQSVSGQHKAVTKKGKLHIRRYKKVM